MKRLIAVLLILLLATPAMAAPSKKQMILSIATEQIGKPYELYSDAPNSFNCVTFVAYCFNAVAPGTVSENGVNGGYDKITSKEDLKAGDILCFKTSSSQKGILGYHFGIYLGKGYFIHASSSVGEVTMSALKSYKHRFVGALRVAL